MTNASLSRPSRAPRRLPRSCTFLLAALAATTGLRAQETVEERLRWLEQKNQELEQKVDALTQEVERVQLGDLVPPVGEAARGVGQGAAKVYDIEQGLSIGGYGEFVFTQRSGRTDVFDALRAILYFGYKFDEHWVFNSEIEIEHGSTSSNSGTTSSSGEVSLEFGYLDYLWRDEVNLRGGLVLVPMGLINELHEPTAFLPGSRPQTESRILPTTWRELGVGGYGDIGGFEWRAYAMTTLDGEDFGASGLRGGRQKGNRVAADDFAGVVRLDWVDTPGLLLGGSFLWGETGQDNLSGTTRIPDLETAILEAHGEYRTGPWTFRALYASAWVNDTARFNTATGANLASRLQGYYGEVGFDVLAELDPDSGQALTPFVRYEVVDTQAEMAGGFVSDPGQKDRIFTFGVNYKPIPQVVLKMDFEDWDDDFDRFNFVIGYVF